MAFPDHIFSFLSSETPNTFLPLFLNATFHVLKCSWTYYSHFYCPFVSSMRMRVIGLSSINQKGLKWFLFVGIQHKWAEWMNMTNLPLTNTLFISLFLYFYLFLSLSHTSILTYISTQKHSHPSIQYLRSWLSGSIARSSKWTFSFTTELYTT